MLAQVAVKVEVEVEIVVEVRVVVPKAKAKRGVPEKPSGREKPDWMVKGIKLFKSTVGLAGAASTAGSTDLNNGKLAINVSHNEPIK